MNLQDRINDVQVGDTVRFSRRWLREHNRTGTDLAKAKGVVTAIGEEDGRQQANVEWDREGMPDLVNVLNLSKVRQREIE
jgi:plastocyanin